MSIKSLTDFVNGTGEYDGWADPSTGKPRSKGLFAEYTAEQKAELLKYYHVSEPSFHENTVRNWLLTLGAVFDEHKKTIFYDGHDKKENREYCSNEYAPKMLAMYRRSHLWKAYKPDMPRYRQLLNAGVKFVRVMVRPVISCSLRSTDRPLR